MPLSIEFEGKSRPVRPFTVKDFMAQDWSEL